MTAAIAAQQQTTIARILIAVIVLWTLLGGMSMPNGLDLGHSQPQISGAGSHSQEHIASCNGMTQCGTSSVVDCLAHCMTTAPSAHTDAVVVPLVLLFIAAIGIVLSSVKVTRVVAPLTHFIRPLYQFATVHLKE